MAKAENYKEHGKARKTLTGNLEMQGQRPVLIEKSEALHGFKRKNHQKTKAIFKEDYRLF